MLHGFERHDRFACRINPEGLELSEIKHLVGNTDDQDVYAGDLQHRCYAKITLQPAQHRATSDDLAYALPHEYPRDVQRSAAKRGCGFAADT